MPDTETITVKIEVPVGFDADIQAFEESHLRCVVALNAIAEWRAKGLERQRAADEYRTLISKIQAVLQGDSPKDIAAARTEILETGVVTANAEADPR
jgi:hypothetical protein